MHDVKVKIVIESQLTYLAPLRKAVHGICSCKTENEELLQAIDLCLNEAVANVICHSYRREPGHEIEIIVTLHPKTIELQVMDLGSYYSLSEFSKELTFDLNDIDNLPESGMGLYIIHELMDEVIYTHSEGKNILFLRKHIQ